MNEQNREQLLKKIKFTYQRAPYFERIYPLFKKFITDSGSMISDVAIQSIRETVNYLDLNTVMKRSSETYTNQELRRTERIIDICKREDAGKYLNPEGGMDLYRKEEFLNQSIILKFIVPHTISYKRFDNFTQKRLSIIDVMMLNSKEDIKKMLLEFDLK